MDYLSEINTLEDKELFLSEVASVKRKDFESVRKSFLNDTIGIDLNELSKQVKNLEIVKITLAIEPTIGITALIDNFFKTNLNKKVLFDFEINKEMIGGLQIVYKGKYFDLSI